MKTHMIFHIKRYSYETLLTFHMKFDMIVHMKRITTSQLQANLTKSLSDLPVEVVRHGQTIAFIMSPDGILSPRQIAEKLGYAIYDEASNMTEKQFQAVLDHAAGDSDGSVALGKVPDSEGKIEDDFIIPTLSVLMCRYCRVKKECHRVVYSDPDGNDDEYFVCPTDMNKLEKHCKEYGGTILAVDGKNYE